MSAAIENRDHALNQIQTIAYDGTLSLEDRAESEALTAALEKLRRICNIAEAQEPDEDWRPAMKRVNDALATSPDRLVEEADERRTGDGVVALVGNLADGFTAHGPYLDFGSAEAIHDGEEWWGITLHEPDDEEARRTEEIIPGVTVGSTEDDATLVSEAGHRGDRVGNRRTRSEGSRTT